MQYRSHKAHGVALNAPVNAHRDQDSARRLGQRHQPGAQGRHRDHRVLCCLVPKLKPAAASRGEIHETRNPIADLENIFGVRAVYLVFRLLAYLRGPVCQKNTSLPPPGASAQVARVRPSAVKHACRTGPVWPASVAISVPVATSHSFSKPSWLPATSVPASGEKASALIWAVTA